jgi:hypothetical protein
MKMYFKGDIIITDPCYFVKPRIINIPEEHEKLRPKWKDYFTYNTVYDYPDAIPKDPSEYTASDEALIERTKQMKEILKDFDDTKYLPKKSKMYDEEFKKLLEAEHEWNMKYGDDWTKTGCGEDLAIIGLTKYLSSDTIYGDWSCTTFNTDTKEPIGKFCADSGMVAVALLDEVLKYNPSFDYHIERKWTTTLIKNFDGEVIFEILKDSKYGSEYLEIVGKGNINFRTKQTGL